MKKVFSIILATLMILATFTACGEKNEEVTPTTGPATELALKVNDNEIMVTEFNFYYMTVYSSFMQSMGDYVSLLQIDTSIPLDEQECTMSDEGSWHDYFVNRTEEQIKSVIAFSDSAKAEGMTLSEENVEQIDTYINKDIPSYAEQDEKTITEFCEYAFGKGMTTEILKTILERFYLSTQWQAEKSQEIVNTSYTDADYEKVYNENTKDCSVVDYRVYSFSYVGDEDTSEEDAAANLKAVKENAAEMASKIVEEADFTKLVNEYCSEDEKEKYAEDDSTLFKKIKYSQDQEVSEWLFDGTRKVGDIKVFDNTYGADVVYVSALPYKDLTKNVDVRHILYLYTQEQDKEATEEEIAAAKENAEKILADWESGEATEESFAKLATENTQDEGSKATGGLYENVAIGDMVKNFENWCFDEKRKIGDTGIVDTEYGYHVMYFSGFTGDEAWISSARTILDSAMQKEIFETKLELYTATRDEAGLESAKEIINTLFI